jgi:hypothetical protein
MGTFITGGTDLPTAKSDGQAPGPGQTATNSVYAADWNSHRDALLDVRDHTAGWVNVKSYGVKADGVTDDTAAWEVARVAADTAGKTLVASGTIVASSTLTMPKYLSGDFTVTGAGIRWYHATGAQQTGRVLAPSVLIAGAYYSRFDHLIATGEFKLDGGADVGWGTFWNTFGLVRCAAFIIDVDQIQSVNQNTFKSVRATGGVRIRGTATSGVREAHNNVFENLDTTGGSLTAVDGTSGYQVLNDSNLNQANTIINWYSEGGSTTVGGNWNVLASNVDGTSTPPRVARTNHYLYAGGTARQGDFFAGSPVNAARGGDWSELSATTGIPLAFVTSNTTAAVTAATNAPDGNPIQADFTSGTAFGNVSFTYALGTSARVAMTAYMKFSNPPTQLTFYVQKETGEDAAVAAMVPLGANGWYLVRVASNASRVKGGAGGHTLGSIRYYMNTGTPNADVTSVGSFFIGQEQTAFLPSYKRGPKEGFGATAPAAGTWAAGDRAWHTAPAAGGAPGWVCTAAGSPGTWKAMANLAP